MYLAGWDSVVGGRDGEQVGDIRYGQGHCGSRVR